VNESEWLAWRVARTALEFLRGKVSERKCRLLTCAYCRRRMHPNPDLNRRVWTAVEASEQYAERCVGTAACPDAFRSFYPEPDESGAEMVILHDIFGNPFRPTALDPAWRTPTVTALATAAYEDRHLPAGMLDADRLAVLADALEEAGCDNADILDHCRDGGPHVRGCWVVDLLLGKR